MDKQTLEALHGSIKKWEDIVAGKAKDELNSNCLLCQLFRKDRYDCNECPVDIKSERKKCQNTPLMDWELHYDYCHRKYTGKYAHVVCPECKKLAQDELNFLRSLLPEGNFKISDRVKVIKENDGSRVIGNRGKIIAIDNDHYAVEFDETIQEGHNSSSMGVYGKDGHCWNFWNIDPVEYFVREEGKKENKIMLNVNWYDTSEGTVYPATLLVPFNWKSLIGKTTRITIEEV